MLRTVTHMPSGILSAAVPLLALGLLAGCAGPGPRDPATQANASLAAGRLDDAVRQIDLAVSQRPRNPALRLQAARIHARADDVEGAIVQLEEALQLSLGPELAQRPLDPRLDVRDRGAEGRARTRRHDGLASSVG